MKQQDQGYQPQQEKNPDASGFSVQSLAQSQVPVYYDWLMEKRVSVYRREGIWTDFGAAFNNVQLRLRTAQSGPVMIKKESASNEARFRLGLSDKDDLPIEESLKVSRAMAVMSVTGARGTFSADPSMLEIARRNGWKLSEASAPSGESIPLITFSGAENAEEVRKCLAFMINDSDRWMLRIFRSINRLDVVEDAKIDAVGESFVFGQHEKLDWED